MLIKNCRIVEPGGGISDARDIRIKEGVISQVGSLSAINSERVIEAEDRKAVPGFIDIHIQGAGGSDV